MITQKLMMLSRSIYIPGEMGWDSDTSIETLARDDDGTIAITDSGTGAPYHWLVEGTGFTLDNAITTGLTNTLNGDGISCGSATITVSGYDGTSIVTGYVRSTIGSWQNPTFYGAACGVPNGCSPNLIVGKYRLNTIAWCVHSAGGNCGTHCDACIDYCNSSPISACPSCNNPSYTECKVIYKWVSEWLC